MMNFDKAVMEVTDQVVRKVGNPVNYMVVLATLESFGVRDRDVSSDYGFKSINDLALHIYEHLKTLNPHSLKNAQELKKEKKAKSIAISDYLRVKARLFTKYYPLGIFHLSPVFIQIITIVFFGYSLWTYLGFNIIQSTAVVFGVILGLTVSGGYVQVMGRQSTFYWHHQEYYKSKVVIDTMISSGIKGLFVTFLAISAVNMFFNLYPFVFVVVTMVYAFLIGLLLLVMASFYTIQQRWFNSVVILLATAFALGLSLHTTLHIYLTHWIGIGTAILLCMLYLHFFFKKKIGASTNHKVKPKTMMVIYKNYHYFFYGILIYVFIFLDRLLAWSANAEATLGYLFLYEKDYEIGMDLAIVIFFLLSGVLEYAIVSFSKFMDIKQKSISLLHGDKFNQGIYRMYQGHIGLLILTAIGATFLVYFFITKSWGYQASFGESLHITSIKVCIIGGLGYLFLTWGMLNALYMFTLNRPTGALTGIIVACCVNFIIGIVSSRVFSYEYSSLGMLVGAFVFMLWTSRETIAYLKKLDYHYYASY